MKHEINTKHKNITRDMIILYLNNCKSSKKNRDSTEIIQFGQSTVKDITDVHKYKNEKHESANAKQSSDLAQENATEAVTIF